MEKNMTRKEALLEMADGYSQSELQYIWETTGSGRPVRDIMDCFHVSRGEATKLWNARNNYAPGDKAWLKRNLRK